MKFFSLIVGVALSSGLVQATPWGNWGNGKCLTAAQAQSIVDRSIIFLEHKDIAAANATAQGLFADDIIEYGDSINSLRGDPPGKIVENGKQSYIKDTLSAPGVPAITTIDIIKDCRKFVWQWQFDGIGSSQYRVRGVTLIYVADSGLVNHQYVEFNSLAWAEDIGYTVTPPANSPFGR